MTINTYGIGIFTGDSDYILWIFWSLYYYYCCVFVSASFVTTTGFVGFGSDHSGVVVMGSVGGVVWGFVVVDFGSVRWIMW
jgi:hypothetical protein